MKILVYGAGVLGSLYAAKLFESGNDVHILARGVRFDDILHNGIVLENAMTSKKTTYMVPVVHSLEPEDEYDLIIVLMRKDQVDSILTLLEANQKSNNILFMVNNTLGYEEWVKRVGEKRIVIGFAGAGGTRNKGVVTFHIVSKLLQPTTIGEINGAKTERVRTLKRLFTEAGFPTTICNDMDAWQKTHISWVSPVAQAIYAAGGSGSLLAKDKENLVLLVKGIKEGFKVLRQINVRITPSKMVLLRIMPVSILVFGMKQWAITHHFDIIATKHTLAAVDEMEVIARDFLSLAEKANIQTPALNHLYSHLLNWKHSTN